MSESRARDWQLYISDMAAFADNVLQYTAGPNPSLWQTEKLSMQPCATSN